MKESCTPRMLAVALVAAGLAGCSWVELTEEGRDVRVADSARGCDSLGRVTATTRANVLGMDRAEQPQSEELSILARNEAADLGADTIVAVSGIEDGRRAWMAYRCNP